MSRKNDKQIAIDWSKRILKDENAVIIDTETNDLYGEIIEFSAIDMQGNTLLNVRIKPQKEHMHPKALEAHGITLKMLENEASFTDVYEQIKAVMEDKTVVIYNAAFDIGRLKDDCMQAKLTMPIAKSIHCAMLKYATYVGDWNDYHGNYRWQRLPSGDHSALGDCLATLAVIKRMAESED